jgi:hypothetical protein
MAQRRPKFRRRARIWGMSMALWEIWTRIPPKHRKQLLRQARVHGPRLAKQAFIARQSRRFRKRARRRRYG